MALLLLFLGGNLVNYGHNNVGNVFGTFLCEAQHGIIGINTKLGTDELEVIDKKWYNLFQMSVFGFEDSFHITEPLLEGTPLTAWVTAPIYAVGYAAILLIIEFVRKHTKRRNATK